MSTRAEKTGRHTSPVVGNHADGPDEGRSRSSVAIAEDVLHKTLDQTIVTPFQLRADGFCPRVERGIVDFGMMLII